MDTWEWFKNLAVAESQKVFSIGPTVRPAYRRCMASQAPLLDELFRDGASTGEEGVCVRPLELGVAFPFLSSNSPLRPINQVGLPLVVPFLVHWGPSAKV